MGCGSSRPSKETTKQHWPMQDIDFETRKVPLCTIIASPRLQKKNAEKQTQSTNQDTEISKAENTNHCAVFANGFIRPCHSYSTVEDETGDIARDPPLNSSKAYDYDTPENQSLVSHSIATQDTDESFEDRRQYILQTEYGNEENEQTCRDSEYSSDEASSSDVEQNEDNSSCGDYSETSGSI